jgi:hypothetical protein
MQDDSSSSRRESKSQDIGLRSWQKVRQHNLAEHNSEVPANGLTSRVPNIRQNAWTWMAAAFCASLGFTVSAVAVFYVPHGALGIALETSARAAFLFFWPAYVGGALNSLFGNIFLPLKVHARQFGLAFAAALLVHLGCVLLLCAIGHAPPMGTFVVFGTAAVFTYLLALLSIGHVRQALPRKFWPPIHAVAMNYIALAFILDFVKFPLSDFREGVKYLPFAVFAIVGPTIKLAAWARNNFSLLGAYQQQQGADTRRASSARLKT